jgi:catechol 2,3-dioxygenase
MLHCSKRAGGGRGNQNCRRRQSFSRIVGQLIGPIAFTLLVVLAGAALSGPAAAFTPCGDRDEILERPHQRHDDSPSALGLSSDGAVLEVLVSPEGGWTILMTSLQRSLGTQDRPRRSSRSGPTTEVGPGSQGSRSSETCVVAVGEAWQTLQLAGKPAQAPAGAGSLSSLCDGEQHKPASEGSMTGLHDQRIEPGAVGLGVRDLARSLDFYRRAIGLEVLGQGGGRADLGVGGRRLLALEERRGAQRDFEAADLFHFALLLTSRAALGRQLRHLLEAGVPLTGASDHHVSEALYLDDPDRHGIELYRDRPRAGWTVDGRIHLITERLDHEGVLAAGDTSGQTWDGLDPGTVMGHVHLQTHDLPAAQRYYVERLGFDVTHSLPQATFMSVGGYHHHVALNVWGRKRKPAAPDAGGIGLLWYELRVPEAALTGLAQTLPEARGTDGMLSATDPDGIPIRFCGGLV